MTNPYDEGTRAWHCNVGRSDRRNESVVQRLVEPTGARWCLGQTPALRLREHLDVVVEIAGFDRADRLPNINRLQPMLIDLINEDLLGFIDVVLPQRCSRLAVGSCDGAGQHRAPDLRLDPSSKSLATIVLWIHAAGLTHLWIPDIIGLSTELVRIEVARLGAQPATAKQIGYIRQLGGKPKENMTKQEASAMIDELAGQNGF